MAGIVLHWFEHAAYGPAVEFLLAADDMAQVRSLCEDLYEGPPDRRLNALPRKDPLFERAVQAHGELLWRVEGDEQWRRGAAAAEAWRSADIARVNATLDDARQRRQHRRRRT